MRSVRLAAQTWTDQSLKSSVVVQRAEGMRVLQLLQRTDQGTSLALHQDVDQVLARQLLHEVGEHLHRIQRGNYFTQRYNIFLMYVNTGKRSYINKKWRETYADYRDLQTVTVSVVWVFFSSSSIGK